MIKLLFTLLFTLILTGMFLIFILTFETPLQKLLMQLLDRLERGRAPTVVKAVSATFFVIMLAVLYNAVAIRRRWMHDGAVNPTDQILAVNYLLQGSLIGFSLFLGLMISGLHHCIRELQIRGKEMEVVKKQIQAYQDWRSGEIKSREKTAALQQKVYKLEREVGEKSKQVSNAEVNSALLQKKVYKLERELEEKSKQVSNTEVNSVALRKQSEGFLLEYDRLLEENQNLRSQLRSLDRRLSFSESKKVA